MTERFQQLGALVAEAEMTGETEIDELRLETVANGWLDLFSGYG